MVDAAASFEANRNAAPAHAGGAAKTVGRAVTVHLGKEALAAYSEACRHAVFSPAQSASWISAWVDHVKPDFLVATVRSGGMPAFTVALEVTRSGPFRIARFFSGRHANGNFPPLAFDARVDLTSADLQALIAAIHEARPDIDMLAFERVVDNFRGRANPLLALPHSPSPNLSLAVDLTGGFDALLGRTGGKRKRKKHRSQTRKFEAFGGFRRVEAKTPEETNALLDAFFVMKEERFRKMGVANVFADAAVRDFFRSLFANALGQPKPPFVLHALVVDGKARAVTGSSRTADSLICEFGAISDDDLAGASPGDFLFFDNIREACEEGLAVYDFSVGDEPYKRLWCDIETTHFDVLVPLTAKGKLLAAATRSSSRIKAYIKNSPAIWRIAKALRRRGAAQVVVKDE